MVHRLFNDALSSALVILCQYDTVITLSEFEWGGFGHDLFLGTVPVFTCKN